MRILFFYFTLLITSTIFCQGKVYFVIGSDTGIWEGLDVSNYTHHYKQGLYTDPDRNAYKVMDPAFRNQMKDSYGTPLKLTWWMMAGNTFRYADNHNVPHPNSIVFYLMKKYHGVAASIFQDELTLHYHNFTWTDYDKDGVYWWNQALTFNEYKEDFQYTLAQLLLEEQVFPVSFRSGWHSMDNSWQNYLEYVLPFSLHNDYPNKHIDTEEPLDNIYDWSQATSDFIPYHPASNNYQLPGDLNGYNVRSVYTKRFNQNMANQIFQNASEGTDQVVCIWSHLPETDFPEQLTKVDSLIQTSANNFTNVDFMYCSAVEAYQNWLKTTDFVSPEIIITADEVGENIFFDIQTNERIFQTVPLIAIKDLYEQYSVLPCVETSQNTWRTSLPVDKNTLVKVGVAVTDTSGNLATKFIYYLPDDIIMDNNDFEYQEIYGNWVTSNISAWGIDSRMVILNPNDSAKARWSFSVPQSLPYNISFQIPDVSSQASSIEFNLLNTVDTLFNKLIVNTIEPNNWVYLTTAFLDSDIEYYLDIKVKESGASSSWFASDVIKISPLVKDKELSVQPKLLNFGIVAVNDTAVLKLNLLNNGINNLEIYSVQSLFGYSSTDFSFPLTLGGNTDKQIPIKFTSEETGAKTDTIFIQSNDPINPVNKVLCEAIVELPFVIVDDTDSNNYYEYGTWATSVAQAYGPSSRYSYLNQNPLASAQFSAVLENSGFYDVLVIVPKTVNSSDDTKYTLSVDNIDIDSLFIDQNAGSGDWINLFHAYFPQDVEINLKVEDTGNSTVGVVLRADAVKFSLINELNSVDNLSENNLPTTYKLKQNYPNPFNPSTAIIYQLKAEGFVSLKVYDILGREVDVLVNEIKMPGYYTIKFNAGNLSSGVYIYRLEVNGFTENKKMLIVK